MNTTFQIGQEVVAKTDQQGLVEGRQYKVVDIFFNYQVGLTYVTYVLESSLVGDRLLNVGNGHLILAAV